MSLKHSLKWSFLSELASKAIQPLVFVVLARLLTPADFGVVTAATMVVAFSQLFWEAGMAKAIIQRQSDVETAANAAFWINVSFGAVVALALYASAAPIASHVFHDARVAAVLQVMSLQVLLGALCSIHAGLLQKEMRFRQLFWVRLATVALPGLASIPLAYGGLGYWALVAGTVIGQAVQVVMLWAMSRWRPRWAFDAVAAKEMARFGAWVGVSGLLAWFYGWADSLIVGTHLGSDELGLYRGGNQVSAMIYGVLFTPVVPVLYSHLARIGGEPKRLAGEFEKIVRILAITAIPFAFTLFAIAEPLSLALFGDRWKGVGFVMSVLALSHGIAWTVGMNGEAYRAVGRPRYETLAMGLPLIVYVCIYLVAIRQGFTVFVWSRMLAMGVGFGFQLYLLNRVLGIHLGRIGWTIAKVTLFMLGSVALTKTYLAPHLPGPVATTVGLAAANISAYLLVLYLTERKGLIADYRAIVSSRASND
ncbi:MAG: lipopolysaccharide biosynthesis protein [Myxococcales bacterium]|nr:lipopolysaccharide biosynthesis protein [Myxococcales bacterium]